MSYGSRRNTGNPYWHDIERCHRQLDDLDRRQAEIPLSAKELGLIRDLHRRGQSYQMNEAQIRYFTRVAQKLYANV